MHTHWGQVSWALRIYTVVYMQYMFPQCNNAWVMGSLMLNEWKPTAERCRGCLSESDWMWAPPVFTLPPPDLLCFMLQCAQWRLWCVKGGLKSLLHCSLYYDVDVLEAVKCYLCLGLLLHSVCASAFLLSHALSELESLHLPTTKNIVEFVFGDGGAETYWLLKSSLVQTVQELRFSVGCTVDCSMLSLFVQAVMHAVSCPEV